MDRRLFLGSTAAAIGAAFGLDRVNAAPAKRAIRIAHLTDVHLQPELRAVEGFTQCLRHVQSQADKPELILFGGDNIMDAFEVNRARTDLQWGLWKKVLKQECSIRSEACIGNHDIFGWNKEKSQTNGMEAEYGKNWAIEVLGIQKRYRSFDAAGWHFVALDSVQPGAKPATYAAYVDEEQFDWLAKDLQANSSKPTLILSHIPLITALPCMLPRKAPTDPLEVYPGAVHTDSRKLADLFAKHPQVKLAISGHIHQQEKLVLNDVTYLCNGAVSANWWKGPLLRVREGYTLIDLYQDGQFESQYVTYGWKAEPVEKKAE
jgi:3',5'-cyclic-AMP phosphodiesterase